MSEGPTPVERNELIALFNAGRHAELELRLQFFANQYPASAFIWMILGASLQAQGKNGLPALQTAVELSPGDAKAYYNLGIAQQGLGRLDAAVASYRQALQINADFAEAHYGLGIALHALGQFELALASYRRALQIKPDYVDALVNLGNTLRQLEQFDEAVASYRQALLIKSDFAEAHFNLGLALHALRQSEMAIASFRRGLQIRPDFTDAHVSLGNALKDLGQIDEAVASYRQALRIRPDYAEVHSILGNALNELGRLDDAAESYRRALQIKPDYAHAHSNLGIALQALGQIDDAVASHRRAREYRPDLAEVHSNLLFALNYHSNTSADEVFKVALEYEARFGAPCRAAWQPHGNPSVAGRRLKLGYVSPDFRRHAVSHFTEPIIANHDREQVEIYCYAEVAREDHSTARLRRLADHWRSTVGMSDDAVAKLIRADEIDVLVDLAGHTAGNRLPVFARKPAPVQVTYLGYPGTTGLTAIDYRITDRYVDPLGSDVHYSERLLRLPHSLWCYRAPADMPEITPLPALTSAYLTYGSFNNFNKIDRATIELWSSLLREQPGTRLMLLTIPEGAARAHLQREFAHCGITPAQLIFHGRLPAADFYRKLLEADIALDPVTVNGGSTSCESLWLGVPVISLTGTRFLSRAGLSLLSAIGMPDLAAATASDFLRIAARLARDLPLLAELRRGLRARMASSPLCNAHEFAKSLEHAYFDMFGRWSEGNNRPR